MWESTLLWHEKKAVLIKMYQQSEPKEQLLGNVIEALPEKHWNSLPRFTKKGRTVDLQFSQTSSNLEPLS